MKAENDWRYFGLVVAGNKTSCHHPKTLFVVKDSRPSFYLGSKVYSFPELIVLFRIVEWCILFNPLISNYIHHQFHFENAIAQELFAKKETCTQIGALWKQASKQLAFTFSSIIVGFLPVKAHSRLSLLFSPQYHTHCEPPQGDSYHLFHDYKSSSTRRPKTYMKT